MSKRNVTEPIAILGAGLTGLSAALELTHRGLSPPLFEQGSIVGGLAVTTHEQGYRFDRTGHLLHFQDTRLRDETLALLDEPPLSFERRSLVYSEGVFTAYPYQSNTHGLPVESAYECVLGFIRAIQTKRDTEPKNFEDYCRIHFGDAISEKFMLPYNGRLWGVAPHEITTEWCARFVPRPTIEDVLAGALGKSTRKLGYNAHGYYPKGGIGELAPAMARKLSNVFLNSKVRAIDPHRRRCIFDHGSIDYQVLISTLPLTALVSLIDGAPEPVVAARNLLRCSKLYYLDVALRRPPKNEAHWVYVPEARFPFYRIGNYAAFSADMAPHGGANLYVELASRTPPDLEQLWPDVALALVEMGMISSNEDVLFRRLRHIEHAYVIYDAHRSDSLKVIGDYLDSVGILSTGRYGGWNYSSMEDALRFGKESASKAVTRLL